MQPSASATLGRSVMLYLRHEKRQGTPSSEDPSTADPPTEGPPTEEAPTEAGGSALPTALPPNPLVRAPGSSNPDCDPYANPYSSYYVPASCAGGYSATGTATGPGTETGSGAAGPGSSSTGTDAGVAVGTILGVAALAAGSWFAWRAWKRRQADRGMPGYQDPRAGTGALAGGADATTA